MFAGNEGYCPICSSGTIFIVQGEWLRDQYICQRCGSIPRQRALVELLKQVRPDWKTAAIHESSPCLKGFERQCAAYTYSHFFEGVPSGCSKNGERCENLEALTFPDRAFDIFITQDVLEHVFRPERVLAEIMRVLDHNGIHIFTVPKHKTLLKSRQRAERIQGEIKHLLPPEYHLNPFSESNSLVTWDYGADLDDLIQQWAGYNTCNFIIRDRRLGIDGEFLDVFVTTKHPTNRLS